MKFLTKDQNWQDATTIYWFEFDVSGETYGVAESEGFPAKILDCDGCPIDADDDKNAHLRDPPNCVTDELRLEN